MLEKWRTFLRSNCLTPDGTRILLAVSGGVDSMLMMELFSKSDFPFGIAHCNFQLRGKASDEDENLVRTQAEKKGIPFHSIRFETTAYARQKGISIEMAARELRYDWFHKLAEKYGYERIATAHHKDDAEETFFLNLCRGTGLKGLRGIQTTDGQLIRPMLCFSRREIEQLAEQMQLQHHEDQSNQEDIYRRNYIRHHILPAFRTYFDHFDQGMEKTMDILQSQEKIYRQHIDREKERLLHKDSEGYYLLWNELDTLLCPDTYLFEILKPYGFNIAQIHDILGITSQKTGKRTDSSTHCLRLHGDRLLIRPLQTEALSDCFIRQTESGWQTDCPFLEVEAEKDAAHILTEPGTASLDATKLVFPLRIRHWKEGDRFVPFGMKGMKKLSDFFTDQKIDRGQKNRIPILCNGNGDILWIIGYRTDNRYRVDRHCPLIMNLRIRKS